MRTNVAPNPNAVDRAGFNQSSVSTELGLNQYLEISDIVLNYSDQYLHGELTPESYASFIQRLFNRLNQYNLSNLVNAKVKKIKEIEQGDKKYQYSTIVKKTTKIYADFILQHVPSDSVTIDEQVRQYINRIYANNSNGMISPLRETGNKIVYFVQKHADEFLDFFSPFNVSDERIYAYFFDYLADSILTSRVFQNQNRNQNHENRKEIVRAILVYVFNAVCLMDDDQASKIVQGVNYVEDPIAPTHIPYDRNTFQTLLDVKALVSLRFNINSISIFKPKHLHVFISRLAVSVGDNDFLVKYNELIEKNTAAKKMFLYRSVMTNMYFLLFAAGMGYLLYWSRTAEAILSNAVTNTNQEISDVCMPRGQWLPAVPSVQESCDIYTENPANNILRCCFNAVNCTVVVNVLADTLTDLCNQYDKYENINFEAYEKISIGMIGVIAFFLVVATFSIIHRAITFGMIPLDLFGNYKENLVLLFNSVDQFLSRQGINLSSIERFVNEPSANAASQICGVIDPILKANVDQFMNDVPDAVAVDMGSSINHDEENQPLLPQAPAHRLTESYVTIQ